jgi:putative radical SAM enzyme (TIGR03279 family)
MLKIISVKKGSCAESNGIAKGDSLISIAGNQINDALDFNFYTASDGYKAEIDGRNGIIRAEFDTGGDNGMTVEEIKIRHCGNKCVFCFIDQNPKGLRKTIYVKDEDYRFSFLYGNYFTLTNIKESELERIAEMKLSPLYISVHAINNEARKKLLGIKKDDGLIDKLRFLISQGIELHTQIVMCPGINDGEILKETIEVLGSLYPGVKSLAVVPVGLTVHRKNLPELQPVTKKSASQTIDIISKFNEKYKKETGTNFVFAADEFYLKAGIEFPEADHYEGYLQYEDGVGMARNFIDMFKDSVNSIPKKIACKTRVVAVTGELFYSVMGMYVLPEFKKVKNLDFELIRVENTLFGNSVTVAGLLSGKDIVHAAGKAVNGTDILLIPSTCLNFDGKFLDDITINDVSKMTGYRVCQLENPVELFEIV